MLAALCRDSGDQKQADFAHAVGFACIDGILSTGDGSKEKPYLVLRTSDEYDVLMAEGKEFRCQSLIHDGDRTLDRMDSADGSSLFFDISDAYRALARRMERTGMAR